MKKIILLLLILSPLNSYAKPDITIQQWKSAILGKWKVSGQHVYCKKGTVTYKFANQTMTCKDKTREVKGSITFLQKQKKFVFKCTGNLFLNIPCEKMSQQKFEFHQNKIFKNKGSLTLQYKNKNNTKIENTIIMSLIYNDSKHIVGSTSQYFFKFVKE